MNEKIKALLGEELSKQVEEKLGTVELAIFNDGSVVPATKFDTLKAEHKELEGKYQTDVGDVNKKLEEALKGTADYDTLKGTIAELQTANQAKADEYTNEITTIKKRTAFEVDLIKANIDENYIPMVMAQAKLDNIIIDGDNAIGTKELVAKTVEMFPKIFGETKMVGSDGQQGNQQNNEPTSYKQQYDDAIKQGRTQSAIKIKQEAYANNKGF